MGRCGVRWVTSYTFGVHLLKLTSCALYVRTHTNGTTNLVGNLVGLVETFWFKVQGSTSRLVNLNLNLNCDSEFPQKWNSTRSHSQSHARSSGIRSRTFLGNTVLATTVVYNYATWLEPPLEGEMG